jgi:hypothetical protein
MSLDATFANVSPHMVEQVGRIVRERGTIALVIALDRLIDCTTEDEFRTQFNSAVTLAAQKPM